MDANVGLSDWAAGPRERRTALVGAAAFVAFALAVLPFATIPLAPSYSTFAMILGASIFGTAITALLLAAQGRAAASPAATVLATGFLASGALMTLYAIVYPGMFGTVARVLHERPGANGTLWGAWHVELLVSIIVFELLRDRPYDVALRWMRIYVGATGVVTALIAAAALWLPWIPNTFSNGHWTPYYEFGIAPAVTVLAFTVLVWLGRRGGKSVLDYWLSIVALAMILDLLLTLAGVTRFTVGWYASRVNMMFATTAVLGVLLLQSARLYARITDRAIFLEEYAHTDTLTTLPNRRRFDEEIRRAHGAALRRMLPLSIGVIDIDFFKRYNDAFGHQEGDRALFRIARVIADSVARSNDFAARYGGEEFIIILEDTGEAGAAAVAERIRNALAENAIAGVAGTPVTVSIGLATMHDIESIEALIGRADRALYLAKNRGRNRVVTATSATPPPIAPF